MIKISNVTIIQKENEMYFGSDSAVSAFINDQLYRLDENTKKLFIINDKIVFCSGNLFLVNEIINVLQKYQDVNLAINEIKHLYYKYKQEINLTKDVDLDIIIGEMKNNKTVVSQISPYNNFKIIERRVNNNNVGLWTGGIKTCESFDIAYDGLIKNKNINEIYQNVFDNISFEGVGGELSVYRIINNNIKLFYKSKIKEKNNIRKLNKNNIYYSKCLVYAERLVGQIIAGVNLTITTGSQDNPDLDPFFLVNEYGVKIQDLDLIITRSDEKSRILANATDGIKIQKNENDSWVDKLYADVDGNLKIAGELIAATGLFIGEIIIGEGNNVFKATASGIQLGHDEFLESPFRVTMAGALTATSGSIGGWIIDEDNGLKLGETITTRGIATGEITFYAGNENPAEAPFRVNQEGELVAENAVITGTVYADAGYFAGLVRGGTIAIGGTEENPQFYVNELGELWVGYSENEYTPYGYFHVPQDADGVFNYFQNPIHDYAAARWKYSNATYAFHNPNAFSLFFGDLGTPSSIKFRVRANGDARVYGDLYVDGNVYFTGEMEDTSEEGQPFVGDLMLDNYLTKDAILHGLESELPIL